MSKASPRPVKPAPKKKAARPAASNTKKKRAPRPKRAALMKKRRRRARILAASGITMIIAATGLMGYAWWIDNSQPGPLEPLTEYVSALPETISHSNELVLTPDIPVINAMECPSNLTPAVFEKLREQAKSTDPLRFQAYALLSNMDIFNDDELMTFYTIGIERNDNRRFGFVCHKDTANRDPNQVAPLTENLDSIPHLLQWDLRWGYVPYGTGDGKQLCIYYTGCGPTCMSMVASYLLNDPAQTPVAMCQIADANGDYKDGVGTDSSFFFHAADALGLSIEELPGEDALRAALNDGKPVIINVGEGDFTREGHYIVAAGIENDKIRILDPASYSNSHLWDFETVLNQTKNMWSFQNPNGNPQNESNNSSSTPASQQNEDSSDYGFHVEDPILLDPDNPSIQGAA